MRYVLIAVALASMGCASKRADEANRRAIACYERKDSACAVRETTLAVSLRPDVPKYRFNHGLALAQAGLVDHAVIEFREVLRLDPGNVSASRALTVAQTVIESRQAKALAFQMP